MEKLQDLSERNIMPPDLFNHYVERRKKAYATGGESVYVPDAKIPGFKVFNWKNPDFPYHFEDHYTDRRQRLGNFGGFEITREISEEGAPLTFYDYSGGLTEEGLKLQEQTEKGLSTGEPVVYSRLTKFLGDHVTDIRFGKNVKFNFEDRLGKWTYKGLGQVEAYGWHDEETITCNGVLLYRIKGNGICFVPTF